jgi:hypothetical protein
VEGVWSTFTNSLGFDFSAGFRLEPGWSAMGLVKLCIFCKDLSLNLVILISNQPRQLRFSAYSSSAREGHNVQQTVHSFVNDVGNSVHLVQ